MKKIKRIYVITAISFSLLSLLLCGIMLGITKFSYAIDTGDFTNGFPTEAFTTNYDTYDPVNYVGNALGNDTSYLNFINNFIVQKNYLDSNNTNPLYVLMKNLETPKSTENFELTGNNSVSEINDKGISYIINHGYNITNDVNTVFNENSYGDVSDNKIKQYVTQIALWLYIYEHKDNYLTTYCKNSGNGYTACDFIDDTNSAAPVSTIRTIITRAAENSDYSYLQYILDLVDNANSYTGAEESMIGTFDDNFSYALANDNSKVYVYNLLPSITGNKDNFMYYAIELNDPNNYGVYIADRNDNKITNTSQMTGSFSIVVPVSDDISEMDLSSVTIKIYAYFTTDSNRTYVVTSSSSQPLQDGISNLVVKYGENKYDRYSDVMLGYSPYQIIDTQFSLTNFTKISKIDVTNSKELPGATLEVKDKENESKVWKWVSEDKPHYLFLDDGSYTLCETIAPSGYERKTECKDFNVESGKLTTVVMENTPINVPNTASRMNKTIIFIGLLLVIVGGGIVSFLTYRKQELKVK